MARVFWDGAELGIGDTSFWDSALGGAGASAAQKRSGSYSYAISGPGQSLTKNINGLAELWLRFGLRLSSVSTERDLCQLNAGTTTLAKIRYEPSTATLRLYVGSTLVATASVSLPLNVWGLVEVHYKCHDSAGSLEMRLDGVDVASYAGDTKPGADAEVDNVYFTGATSLSYYLDDLALDDADWVGDGYVEYLSDAGNGAASQWTGSDGNQVDNYQMTDEIPPDGDTTYITDSTPGNRDMATVAAWDDTYKSIRLVRSVAVGRGEAGGEQIKLGVRTNGVVYNGTDESLLSSYRRVEGDDHAVNPQTLENWTANEIAQAQSVVETVAV